MLNWLKKNPAKGSLLVLPIIAVLVYILVPHSARAAITFEGAIVGVLGWIFSFFVYILGNILVKFIDLLVWVAQYNDFINAEAVRVGWTVVRDLANMFFIVALLVISFGTVFRIQEYRYNRLLSKVIIMAVLINFSKMIAAFFIDVSQVIMLTFVNAFKDMAAGNLTSGFGIDNIVSFSQDVSAQGGDISVTSVAGAMFAAVIMLFVATVVVAIFTLYLVQRIVMLWIYIILSPMAYMLAVFPGSLGSFWSTWWRDFTQYVIRGPVIAFFLWLALTIISLSQATSTGTILGTNPNESQVGQLGGGVDVSEQQKDLSATASKATTSANILNYLMAVGLLVAGLMQTAKAGGAAGSVAGKWMGNFQKWGGAMATSPIGMAKGVLKRPAYGVAGAALGTAARLPLVGTTFGKLNARMQRQRQRAEEKDTDWINYADERTVKRLALAQINLTEGGRKESKIARERLLKKNELKNYKTEDQDRVLNDYRRDIGYKEKERSHGDFHVSYRDSYGGQILEDAYRKNPSLRGRGYAGASPSKQAYLDAEMKKLAQRMTLDDFAKSEPKSWEDNAANAPWLAQALPILDARLGATGSEFLHRFDANVPESVKDTIRTTMGGRGYTTAFQEEIDQEMQKRTAEQVAEYEARGLDFHESAEYRAAPKGTYYDKNTYGLNERQRQRVEERMKLTKEQGDADLTAGISMFAKGSSNMLAVDQDVLDKAGIKLAAGGHVKDKRQLTQLAGALSEKLNSDITDIEGQISGIALEEADMEQPTGMDASGRQMTQADQNPQRMQEIAARREALEAKRENFVQARNRLQSGKGLEDMQFINKDSYVGNRWNLIAEEATHKKMDQMDPDGSFRKGLMGNMSPEEIQSITQAMRAKTGDETLSDERAFEEYLTKGLVNVRGEKYADTMPDAVKLKSGLALDIKRQAEAKGVKISMAGLEPEEIEAPGKVGGVSSRLGALGRKVTQPYREVREASQKSQIARSAEATMASQEKLDQLNQEYTQAEQHTKAEEDNLKRLQTISKGKVDKLMGDYNSLNQQRQTTTDPRQASEYARQMNAINGQVQAEKNKVSEQQKRVEASRQNFAEKQKQLSLQNSLTKKFEAEQAAKEAGYAATIPGQKNEVQQERMEAEKVLPGINQKFEQKKTVAEKAFAELEEFQKGKEMNPEIRKMLKDAEASRKGKHKKTLKYQLGKAENLASAIPFEERYTVAGTGKADPELQQKIRSAAQAQAEFEQAEQEKASQDAKVNALKTREAQLQGAQKAARPVAPKAVPPPVAQPAVSKPAPRQATAARTVTQPAAKAPEKSVAEAEAPATPISVEQVNRNNTIIHEEIKGAMPKAPSDLRDIFKVNPASYDNLLRQIPFMRELNNRLRFGFEKMFKASNVSDITQEAIRKQLANLQKHTNNNDSDSYREELKKLHGLISSNSGGASEEE
jgi:hypothetical protein